ncbi:MATE family efflux transporter [Candidatus Stoquefichus massiliensis]|uniref:MATE family efflux transporter n=1 Tax=Candidatus Stoquefichus massiliensis TaxID=1470350 RepID=UPI0004808986|nr:MATE family efflux transporter [Candidatus Stoquefichus massiliensis]
MKKSMNLLEGPIFKTLMKLALPIMGTSLIQMAYNLIDMIWIGRIGASAVAAVGSAGMYMWLSNGISTLAKMGGQVCVGQAIGSNQKKQATQYASATIQLGIIFGLLYGILTLLFYKPMIGFFNLTSTEVIYQAEIYLIVTCGFVVVNFINQIFTSLMTAIGNSHHPFIATTVGLILNIILDPLLIFTFNMGVPGAAIATVISQIIVMLMMIYYARKDSILFDEMKIWVMNPYSIYSKIMKIGLPTGLQSLCFTFISMVIARFIAGYGDVAIAVQKVGSQIESISWMSAEGFGNALNAFVAQNYGANNIERVKKGTYSALKTCIIWGIFTTAVLFIFPQMIFQIFITEKDVIPLGVDYLQILAFSQLFMCIESTLAGTLNGLGKTFIPSSVSVILTAARIPLVMILSSTVLALNGIWWAISISSIAKGLVIAICYYFVMKKIYLIRQ